MIGANVRPIRRVKLTSHLFGKKVGRVWQYGENASTRQPPFNIRHDSTMGDTCTTSGPFGVFPDCEGLGASVFLNLVYGYALLTAAGFISDGSELLLEILSPGLVGGLLLPILGAVPDAAVIIASGLGASKEDAQEQVSVGMGTLAGSTVMLLTIAWGGSLILGRCDLSSRGTAINKTLTPKASITEAANETGVTTDTDTKTNAMVMMASCVTFLVIQIPAWMGMQANKKIDLATAAVALGGLALYCGYQVLFPELQRRKIAAAQAKAARKRGAMFAAHLGNTMGGILVDGEVNVQALNKMFEQFDSDGNNEVDVQELKLALVAMSVTMQDTEITDGDVEVWLKEFDKDGDGLISRAEFCAGMTYWVLEQAKNISVRSRRSSFDGSLRGGSRHELSAARGPAHAGLEPLLGSTPEQEAGEGQGEEDESDVEDEDDEEPMTKSQIIKKAMLFLAIGMAMVTLFADPMVGAVSSLSKALGLPSPFFASFVLTPFASNASELVSSLYFASKKRKKNISLTYSQVYGAVTMNNTMCLGLFMVVMRAQGLEWTFSSETLTILLVTLLVGYLGASRETFKSRLAVPVLALYPLSIALVCFLDFVVGWN